jgi:hypothetical protein
LHNRRAKGACAQIGRLMTLCLASACVVPIPASPDEGDAGPRKDTPVIVRATPTDFPGPLQLPGPENISLLLRDHDIADRLYVRVYRNYDSNPGRGIDEEEVAPSNGPAERTVPIETAGWCQGVGTQNVFIDIVVADEMFDDDPSTDFPYKQPINDGRWSERNFIVACNEP